MDTAFTNPNDVNPRRAWSYTVTSTLVKDRSLSVGARLTHILLKSFDGKRGCYPTLGTLGSFLGRSRPVVQAYLIELERAGYLQRNKQKDAGRFSSNRYVLHDSPQSTKLTAGKLTTEKLSTKKLTAENLTRNNSQYQHLTPTPCKKREAKELGWMTS